MSKTLVFESVEWPSLSGIWFEGSRVWYEGDHVYYSDGSTQLELDKSTNTWVTKTWNGLSNFTADNIWTDGVDIYYSAGDSQSQYKLNVATSTWVDVTWDNFVDYFYGSYVWTDGVDIYYSNDEDQYIYDISDHSWTEVTWISDPPHPVIYGNKIWTHGTEIYQSEGYGYQFQLDKANSTWSIKNWSGAYPDGSEIWRDGNDICYSDGDGTQYVLNESTGEWDEMEVDGCDYLCGSGVWTDGTNTYFSTSGEHYKLHQDSPTPPSGRKNFADNSNMVSIMTATGQKIKERAKIFFGTESEWDQLSADQKKSYDYWASPETSEGNAVPEGGTTGQVLAKASNADFDMAWQSLGTAAGKDYTDTIRPNSHDLAESGACYSAINNALSSIYTPRGDLTCAELTSSLLIEANIGDVYEMSDAGTTSALFINGAGHTISVGDNVGIIKAGENDILFNLMGNAFDLHDYQKKALDTPITVGGVSKTTVEDALSAINVTTAQRYAKSFNSAHDRYIELGTIPYSSSGLNLSAALDIFAFYDGGIGQISVDIQSRNNALRVKGWTDINLGTSAVGTPRFIVTNDNNETYHIYIDCNYAYLYISMYVKHVFANLTVTNFPVSASVTGTEVFNSATNQSIVYVNKINSGLSYSTSETKTGGTWIDGKPIYRKVVDCGNAPSGSPQSPTSKTTAHNISNIGTVVKLDIYGSSVTGSALSIPFIDSQGNVLDGYVDSTNVTIRTNNNASVYHVTAIIEYTKTTD